MNNNKVHLAGNLGRDPEVKTFDNGGKIVTFRMATKDEYRNNAGEKATSTQWHTVSARGKMAELIAAELKKGSFVSIEGRLSTRNYTDKAGLKKYITEVVATDVVLDKQAA